MHNANGGYELYDSIEAYEKEQERRRMIAELRKHFNHFGNNEDTYEAIKSAYDAIFEQKGD